jgi:hypothetical protein
MTALTLKERVNSHHTRLTAPDRPCDKCLEQPSAGEELQIASIQFPAGTVVFSVCRRCAAEDYERFKGHLMSHEAASIFMCHQEQGLNKLSDELVRMNEWIAKHSAPGEPCDECGSHLLDGEPISTASVAMTGGMSGYQVMHAVCPRCAKTETPRLRAKCDRFLARLVSTRASVFIRDLIDPKKVVQ